MKKIIPFSLTIFIILADQMSKTWIVRNYPIAAFVSDVFNNDLLWIIHVRNKAVAFSLGNNLPMSIRPVLFVVLPIVVLGVIIVYYFRSKDFTLLQRWAVVGIIGGGLGNIIDRITRPEGVVDFISVKFFGIFGLDRWPTFNIADSAVVVCCIILLLSMIFDKREKI
ncbi:MAG: signal peptidase II [Treponema sp.]|jgi:signal peptidase II|nr:signal peptidase II [Treponema sp.]